MKVDLTDFNAALKAYVKESKMEIAEAVDKKAIDIAFRANKETKKANRGSIQPKGSQIYYVLAATGATRQGKSVKGKGNKKTADKIASRRFAAINYNKSLWLKLASDLGATVKSLTKKASKLTHAKGTKSKKGGATDKPFAVLEINRLESDNVAEQMAPSLKKAVAASVEDMKTYIARKIAERSKKYSGRKSGKK